MNYKIPWAAALLNFIVPGTGYIYVGKRFKFGVLLVAAMALQLFGPTPEHTSGVSLDSDMLVSDPGVLVLAIAAVIMAAGFAYDGYTDAVEYNDKLSKEHDVDSDSTTWQ